jgi:thiol-disulfide isomerase/thioredoxin
MNCLYTIILFLSFSFTTDITPEQLGKVKEITKDINKASDFSLKSISVSDSIYTLSKMNDKVILINFWATWCGPCRMEIPDFNHLYEKYSEKGFEILGISISDTKDQLTEFLKAYKMDYPVLYGNQTEMQKIVSDYGGVHSVPMSFLIGKDNQIKRVYPGAILKQYDPNMYSDLIFNIEVSLSEKHQEDNLLNLPNE